LNALWEIEPMCLAVPGKIVSISDPEARPGPTGLIDFQGNRVEASLVMTPEARAGDWVLVHAGFSIQVVEERDALETWEYLQMGLDAQAAQEQGEA